MTHPRLVCGLALASGAQISWPEVKNIPNNNYLMIVIVLDL